MHICQTRRTLMMVKPPPPYSFLPQSLVHFLFLCLFSTFSIFNRPWENFSRDQEESVDRDRIRWLKFGSISIIKLGVPTLTRPAPRLLEIVRPVAPITPVQHTDATSRVGHKKSGLSIFPYLNDLMRHTSWGGQSGGLQQMRASSCFFFLPLQAISSYNTLRACFQFQAKENEFQKHF